MPVVEDVHGGAGLQEEGDDGHVAILDGGV